MKLDIAPGLLKEVGTLEVEATETQVPGLVVVPEVFAAPEGPRVTEEAWRIYNPASASALPLRFERRYDAVKFVDIVLRPTIEKNGWSWEDLREAPEEQSDWFMSIALLTAAMSGGRVELVPYEDEEDVE